MKYRKLGTHGPKVSSVGLGCMTFTESYGLSDKEAALQVIQKAYENGITFFDTADAYGHGANEKLLGKAAKSFRKNVVIASKCGIQIDPSDFT
ncbi:MAG TPA: aldo/keto reductase, partial [Rhabdochlamydiaceae bacterium]